MAPMEGVKIYGTQTELFAITQHYVITKEQLFYEFNVMLKYLTVEHLHFLVANHEVVKVIIGDGIEAAVLERLDDKAAGLLFEEALNAEDYATLIGEVLRHIALVLIIILANHTLVNEIHGSAHLAGRQNRFALLELHGYKNAPQSINALRSERAINTGNLSCHFSTSVHCLLF